MEDRTPRPPSRRRRSFLAYPRYFVPRVEQLGPLRLLENFLFKSSQEFAPA